MRSSMDPRSVCFGVRSRKLSNVSQSLDGWPKMYYLELLRASEGTLSRRVTASVMRGKPAVFVVLRTHQPALGTRAGLRPVFKCVIHKECLCPSSRDINRLMMMTMLMRSGTEKNNSTSPFLPWLIWSDQEDKISNNYYSYSLSRVVSGTK
jgi:hypothetical protein